MDLESLTRWEEYSRAKDEMFVHTDIPEAPWYVVESDDKRRARLNMIAHLLSTVPYRDVTPPELHAAAAAAVHRLRAPAPGSADLRSRPRGGAGGVGRGPVAPAQACRGTTATGQAAWQRAVCATRPGRRPK